jgi:hypothetical protein
MILNYSDIPKWIKTLKRLGDYPPPINKPEHLLNVTFTWSLDGNRQYIKPYKTENSPIVKLLVHCKVLGEGDMAAREEDISAETLYEDVQSGFLTELKDESILAKLALLDF